MTGTAATEGPEFDSIYKLPVTVVPTNQSVKRTDESDVVFRTEEGKASNWDDPSSLFFSSDKYSETK